MLSFYLRAKVIDALIINAKVNANLLLNASVLHNATLSYELSN